MTTPKIDCGLDVVHHFFNVLELDERACVREERGFTWWGEDLAQRVWSEPPLDRGGTRVWKVHARSDFLKDFVDTEEHLALLTQFASFASLGGGLVRNEQHRDRIHLESCLYATERNVQWAKLFFPSTAATQASEAHFTAKMLPPLAGCSAAYSEHPVLGPQKHHRALDVLGTVIRGGKNPPVWTSEEFEETADELDSMDSLPVVTDSGIIVEFPFRDSKAVCEMTTKVEHPSYGHGLLVRLDFPVTLSDAEDPEVVLRCNSFELKSVTHADHFTGSYYVGDDGFSYCNFIPNLESYRGVPFLNSLITFMGCRAAWFAESVGGDDWLEVEHPKRGPSWLN